jgi:hypothetical protein
MTTTPRFIVNRAGTILSLTLLTGCALVGPDHQTPETELSTAFANASQPGLSNDPIAILWWQGFKDKALHRLADRAVAGNHDLRIATAHLREAQALRSETVFDRYPTVTAGASYANERLSTAAIPGAQLDDRDRELYNAGFDAFWELDFFGRVRRSIEARTAEVEATEASLRNVLVSLIAEVARNYFELRGPSISSRWLAETLTISGRPWTSRSRALRAGGAPSSMSRGRESNSIRRAPASPHSGRPLTGRCIAWACSWGAAPRRWSLSLNSLHPSRGFLSW